MFNFGGIFILTHPYFSSSSIGHNNISIDKIKQAIQTFAGGYLCQYDAKNHKILHNCFNYSMLVGSSPFYFKIS